MPQCLANERVIGSDALVHKYCGRLAESFLHFDDLDYFRSCPESLSPGVFMTDVPQFKLRGRAVQIDKLGRVRLNDIHKAGGFTVNQKPTDWIALATTQKLAIKVCEKTSGKSGRFTKSELLSVICSKVGAGGGVWVHPNLALAYAKYLSADLHYEVNEVFLRYKGADPTLADDILQRSTPEANLWAGHRAMGRAERNGLTLILKDHGVTGWGYGRVTNAIYLGLFDANAGKLRKMKGAPKGPLRDKFETSELAYTAATEHLAGERIVETDCQGNRQCESAAAISSGFMRAAIDADRASRRKAP